MEASPLAWAVEERARLAGELDRLDSLPPGEAAEASITYFRQRIEKLDGLIRQFEGQQPPTQ